jgi:hypothetical protein
MTAVQLSGAEQDKAFLRPFRFGLLGVAIGFVLLGALIAGFGTGKHRPEGVAERWLTNVGDTTRDGVKDRARREADEVGDVELARHLLPKADTDGRAAFVDLEVGKAVDLVPVDGRLGPALDEGADAKEVPFRLHQRIDGDAGPAIDGVIVLTKAYDDEWSIVAVKGPRKGLEVPSEGGRPAAEAGPSLFLGAILVSSLVAGGCALAVRAATPKDQRGTS